MANTTNESVIDLNGLKARCLGNLNLVERVLNKFATQLDVDIEALELAVLNGDVASAAAVAHRIKGMSANVEAHDLYATANAAERLAREACMSELPMQVDQMRRDRRQIVESLKHVDVSSL